MNSAEYRVTGDNTVSGNASGRSPHSHKKRRRFWIMLFVVLVLAVILVRCYSQDAAGKHKHTPAQAVVVAKATSRTVPVYLSALGSVTPTYSVTVKTQVNGQLLQVFFHEGQLVKTGDVLAQIDPRPLQAQVEEFQGQLARDAATLVNAKIDLTRYQTLYKLDSVSEQTLATQAALVKELTGTVKYDQGQLDAAQVNLNYCRITSPIDGRVGLRLVDPGNYVQTSDTTGICVLNTLDPITVIFAIPEDNVPQVAQQIYAGQKLPVTAYDRSQTKVLATGSVMAIDNQIATTTGTVNIRASFANPNNVLFPSQFVNVQLLVKTLQGATLIPTAAIQQGANNSFVYLLNANNTVSVTPVVTSVVTGDDTVVTGISPGQSVVVQGADKLTDGAAVSVQSAQANTSPNGASKTAHHKNTAAT